LPFFAVAGVIGIVGTLLFAAPLKRTMRVKRTRTQPVPTALLLSSPTKFLSVPERSSRKVDRPIDDSMDSPTSSQREKFSYYRFARSSFPFENTETNSSTSWRSREAERFRQKPLQRFCLAGFVPASSVQLQSDGLQSIFRSKRSRYKKACSLRSPILL